MKSVLVYLVVCFGLIYYSFSLTDILPNKANVASKSNFKTKKFNSMEMFDLIEKYSEKYNIPKYIAYNVAYRETRYMGPFHWSYNPKQESCVGAVGPMQVLTSTCNWVNNSNYTKSELMGNMELNIMTSMKLLNKLYRQYKDWSLVCGWYNTGKPIINEYARYCSSNKDYKSKWLSLN